MQQKKILEGKMYVYQMENGIKIDKNKRDKHEMFRRQEEENITENGRISRDRSAE